MPKTIELFRPCLAHLEIRVDGALISSINAQDVGWEALQVAENVARDFAQALGATVSDNVDTLPGLLNDVPPIPGRR